jgi:4-amino-4-deoxy-L-arabinose transferase-like glycosyltransferase
MKSEIEHFFRPGASGAAGHEAALDLRALAYIVALAIAVRLAWAWMIPVIPISDSQAYEAFALTMSQHGVFGWTAEEPFAFWPPGTTFFHALMYVLFGPDNRAIVGLNIALSAGIIITSARVACRFFGSQVATVSAATLALWPTLVMYSTILASELPFLFLTILSLDIWTSERTGNNKWWLRGAAAGAVLGLAALVRPVALLLPAVYACSLLVQGGVSWPRIAHQLRIGAAAVLAMAIVIGPWTLRNHALFGEPVLISTNGGITLWMGNAPGTDGSYMFVPEEYAGVPDNEQARILGGIARQHIKDEPLAFVFRSFRKLFILYANESIGVAWNKEGISQVFGESAVVPLKRFTQLTWAMILLVALLGVVVAFRRDGVRVTAASPLFSSVVYYSAVHSVIVAQDRYHLSFATQVAVFFSIGAIAIHRGLKARRLDAVFVSHEPQFQESRSTH